MLFNKKVASMLLIIFLAAVSSSEALEKLSLREAISRGMDKNNQARAARFQADSARSAATAASLHYLPTISFEEAWARSDLPVNTFMMKLNQGRFTNQDFDASKLNNPSPTGDFRTALTIEMPLLIPEAWAARNVAKHGAEQQEATTEQVKQHISFRIFQIYLEVQKAHANIRAVAKALEEARESKRQASVRTSAGLGLKSDELRADTNLASVEQRRISADNNLTLWRMRLALATGGQPGDETDVAEEVRLKAPDRDLSSFVEIAGQERRDLHAAERGKDQADAALMQARSKFLPTLGAFGSWQMNDKDAPFSRDHDSWTAGVALRWNIFDGFRNWHGSAKAQASRSAANEIVEQTRREVSLQVHEAWLLRLEALKRLEVAASSLKSAEETVRLLTRRFENSLATMLELLDAQSALNQARANLVESDANVLLATGALYQAAGIFIREIEK